MSGLTGGEFYLVFLLSSHILKLNNRAGIGGEGVKSLIGMEAENCESTSDGEYIPGPVVCFYRREGQAQDQCAVPSGAASQSTELKPQVVLQQPKALPPIPPFQ